MDISKLVSSLFIFLPLFFGIFLLYARIALVIVNKKVLNYGLFSINLISVLSYILIFINKINIDFSFDLFDFSFYNLKFNLNINQQNISFLLVSSLFYFIVTLFLIKFFKLKKQFLFTKQRYYSILSFLIFNTNLFICSKSVIQSLVFWMIQTVILFVFLYLDIFKTSSKTNITRFLRLDLLCDFSLLIAVLVLLKHSVVSNLFSNPTNFSFDNIQTIFKFMLNNNLIFESKLVVICLLIIVLSKLAIFPFSCRYSFLANSSDAVYLPVLICSNNILGCYLFFNASFVFEYFSKINVLLSAVVLLTILTSGIFLLYEKNIKIIFGYILSIINALFIYFSFKYESTIYFYFVCLLSTLLILSKLFANEKNSLKKRIINKYKGFYLERLHIYCFEVLFKKISNFLILINEAVFKFLRFLILYCMNSITNRIYIRYLKATKISVFKNIFFVFGIFIIFIIILILFMGVDFG